MIKIKDGYAKLIGTTASGSINRVLLSNGGDLQYAIDSTASTLVLRNASGQIESSVASTVAPFVISSTKVNTNLNADLLDGFLATALFQSLTSTLDKNLYIKIGNTEKEISLLYASYLGGVTKEGLFTELVNVNDSTNPNSIKVTIGGTTKYLKVAYSDLASKVVCSASANNIDRPIVVTNKSNGLHYSIKATLNYSTGNITAPTFTGALIGNANTATTASKLSTVSKTAWGRIYWTSEGVPTDISGDMTNVENISINSRGDVDRFITFDTASTRSWRMGYLGTGSGDANYLIFLSTKTATAEDGWYDMLKIGCESGNATFAGQVIAPKFVGTLNNTLTFSVGPFSAKTYNNSEAIAVNIPTHTSHLTNNSGFVTGGPYLPTAGGTLTGPLTFANGVWNVVGDDAAIGDYNAAGMLGIKSCNNAIPGIGFHNSSNTLLGRLLVNEGTLLWNDYTVLHSNNSSVSGGGSSWGSSISVTINGTTSTLKIPSKPSVGNGTVTIKLEGTSKGSFTMNQSSATTIELTDTWRPITDSYSGTVTTTSLSQKGANDLYNAVIGSIPTVNNGKITIKLNDTEIGSFTMNLSGASTIELTDTTYGLVGASGTIGLIKNQSTVTSATGYTACPIINGVPYYLNTILGNSGVTAGTYTPTPKTVINSTHQSIQVPELDINAQGLITKASLKNVPITGSFYIASNKTLTNSDLSFITSIAIAPGYTVTFPTPSASNLGKIIFVKAAYGNTARYVSGKLVGPNYVCSTAATNTINIGYYSYMFVCMDYGSGHAWVWYYCG